MTATAIHSRFLVFALTLLCHQAQSDSLLVSNKLATPKTDRHFKIAYVMKAEEAGNPYWPRVRAGAMRAATDLGIEVVVQVPDPQSYDVAKQINLVNALADSDIDGMVITPIDTQALAEPVEALVAKGKVVIVQDTPLNSQQVLTQITTDNFNEGLRIGRWLSETLSGGGDVAILEGPSQSLNAVERRNGFLSGIATGRLNIVDIRPTNWGREEARRLVTDWLQAFPDLKGIMASSASMALGAMEALRAAGRRDIIIAGIDAPPVVLEAITAGDIHAAVDQQPEQQSHRAVQLLLEHLQTGVTYPDTITWEASPVITADNVAKFLTSSSP